MSDTPKLCQSCEAIVEESGLHFVECGGIQNGLKTSPKVWRLRPKNEAIREAQITKDLQRLSRAVAFVAMLQDTIQGGGMVVTFNEADIEEMKHIVEGKSK
jgi:hypothetical protein